MTRPTTTRTSRLGAEAGQGLVELLIALVMLAIAVSALLAVLTSSALSLQRSSHRGTALTLANQQLELYRRLGYANIRLYGPATTGAPAYPPLTPKVGGACPYAGSDPYFSANCSDPSIPAPTNLVVDQTTAGQVVGGPACPTSPVPPECAPGRLVNSSTTPASPDKYDYRVDTYITYVTPTGGRQLKQVYVVVRDNRVPGKPILARNASTFDQSNVATG
jgi:type II secretory pathway pseudopilin PulG